MDRDAPTHDEASETPQATSVRHLQGLYSVVVAIALTLAVERLLPGSGSQTIRPHSVPLFVALLVTIVPFYHGTLRHLDDVYIEKRGRGYRSGAVLLDFFALFIEGCLLLGLGAVIAQPRPFGWLLLSLLLFDIAWAIFTRAVLATSDVPKTPLNWLRVNAVAAVVLSLYLAIMSVAGVGSPSLEAGILAIALLRSIADYLTSWRFYAALL
jgi:hypothetical protein